MLCPCFGDVQKDILLWGKQCPMFFCQLKAALVDAFQSSTVILRCLDQSYSIDVVNKADPRKWSSVWVAGVNKVGIV